MTRFVVSSTGRDEQPCFAIFDVIGRRVVATSDEKRDAEFIGVKLNADADVRTSRQALALQLWGFRLKLEYENGGPLIGDPGIGLVLDDLCEYLKFEECERALVLGPDLLVYLNALDNPEVSLTSELVII